MDKDCLLMSLGKRLKKKRFVASAQSNVGTIGFAYSSCRDLALESTMEWSGVGVIVNGNSNELAVPISFVLYWNPVTLFGDSSS